MSFINNLEWRFATKKFDPIKKVKQIDLEKILKAIRYSPSSIGLQPFHVVVVSSYDLKNKFKPATRDQEQVVNASYVLVFCVRKDRKDLLARIDNYVAINARLNKVNPAESKILQQTRQKTILKRSDAELFEWAGRQTYIALGFALAACAEFKIDSCPMEGFEPEKMDKILKLPKHLRSIVLLPIGFRVEDPTRKKIRFSDDDLFTFK